MIYYMRLMVASNRFVLLLYRLYLLGHAEIHAYGKSEGLTPMDMQDALWVEALSGGNGAQR
jgi:hypothetical protein